MPRTLYETVRKIVCSGVNFLENTYMGWDKTVVNRIEILRKYIDEILLNMTDVEERRCAYLHLYGVAQSCALIALKRGENAELAIMAGMLHDIYSYSKMDSKDHAHKGAILAGEILTLLRITNDEETKMICDAIYTHSEKGAVHSDFNEILIDADVFQHCLYNPMFEIMAHEKNRYERLKLEFGIA
jgi:predicted hydrolase (HD superfamily)